MAAKINAGLARLLGSAPAQRALLSSTPFLRGELYIAFLDAGLIEGIVRDSASGRVHRRYTGGWRRTPLWGCAAEAVMAARRRRNLTVDPALIGPSMRMVPTRYGHRWAASYEGRDGPAVLRAIGAAAAEQPNLIPAGPAAG